MLAFSILGLDLRNRCSIQVIEQIQYPEARHECHVKTPDDFLLKLSPIRDPQVLNDLIRSREMLVIFELFVFDMLKCFLSWSAHHHLDMMAWLGALRTWPGSVFLVVGHHVRYGFQRDRG